MRFQYLLIAAALCLFIACEREDVGVTDTALTTPPVTDTAVTAPPVTDTTATAGGVTVAQIMENPALYENRKATVVGEVEEVYSPYSFKLDEDDPLAGGIDQDLLVVGVPGTAWAFDGWREANVRVNGTIRTFNVATFRDTYDYDFAPEAFTAWEGRPVMVADTVERVGP